MIQLSPSCTVCNSRLIVYCWKKTLWIHFILMMV
nr:MAG TPA: hypothetical protein [Caudoviricetes sp.]